MNARRVGQQIAAVITHQLPQERKSEEVPAIEWRGKQRDFARLVRKLYKDGKIAAKSETDAFNIMCAHFVHKGKQMSARSLRQNLQNQEDEAAGDK